MKKIFTLLSVVALGISANAQNLLTNPGFESGLASWAAGTGTGYTAPTISTTDVHSGSNAAGYTSVGATTGFYQNVPVVTGKTYVITFWYKATGDGTDGRIWSVYKDASGAAVYTTADASTDQFRTNDLFLPPASVWTKYTAEMPAGPGVTNLDVAFRAYKNCTLFLVDDVSVEDKSTLGTIDIKDFDKKVKMNTLVAETLTLELPSKSTVNIYSIDGKLVSSNRVNSGEAINVSKLQKGNYIVTVEDGANKISRKIVKQ
jgi:hypothetical protein